MAMQNLPDELVDEFIRLYWTGRTITDIREELGIPDKVSRNFVKRYEKLLIAAGKNTRNT